MKEYDVIIIGGGIAGSIASKIMARSGLNTLLLEKDKIPRNKVCSGVQLKYMEKLIGEKIPRSKLCKNELRKVNIITPKGRKISGNIGLLNYWRNIFDYWLNQIALENGVEIMDNFIVNDIIKNNDRYIIKNKASEIKAKYILGADGLSPNSISRKILYPENFSDKITGAAINYFFEGTSTVEKNSLYIFYRKEFSNLMYSWVYYKDNKLIIGTSGKDNIEFFSQNFFQEIEKKFDLKGSIIRREGYVTHCNGGICLGKDRILLAGDAAGLLDLYRGVGMDIAAISGNLAGKSIVKAYKKGNSALRNYQDLSRKLINQIERNNQKQEFRYSSDKALEDSLSNINILKGGVKMGFAKIWNKFSSLEDFILLPP
ncbi:MAG: hypothetical protein GF329_18750 [Candidatus Lokiarchaeota archaeon]|nr:hypothetical protein [Candidatus Lokiarchaeota archaeon]